MATKKTAKKTPASEKKTAMVKFIVSEEQQDLIRLAAALKRKNMADFAREIVLEEAERLTKGIKLPGERD
jgi:uncharacterized protein (DUF1778 family)